jgi:hypothetical protein
MNKTKYIQLLQQGDDFEVLYNYHLEKASGSALSRQEFFLKVKRLELLTQVGIFNFQAFLEYIHAYFGAKFETQRLYTKEGILIAIW